MDEGRRNRGVTTETGGETVCTFICDPETRAIVDVDARFAAFHDHPREDAVGSPITAFYDLPFDLEADCVETATERHGLARTGNGCEVPVTIRAWHAAVGVVGHVRRSGEDRVGTEKIRRLHHAATDIVAATDVESAYQTAVETAETVLEFDLCAILVADDDVLRLAAESETSSYSTHDALEVDKGVTGLAYREGRSILVGDAEANPVAQPAHDEYASAITVPIGDDAIFQAISTVEGDYDRHDLELAELLAIHVEEAVERIRSEQTVRETKCKIERLHTVATTFETCTTHDDLFEVTIDAAEDILGFDWCGLLVPEDGWFVLAAVSSKESLDVGTRVFRADEGVAGEIYRDGKPQLVTDVSRSERAKPAKEAIQSALGVPIGDVGVLQAAAGDVDAFDETDLELAELLAANVAEAHERIDAQNSLKAHRRELQRLVGNLPGMVYRTRGGAESPLEYVSDGAENLLGYDGEALTSGRVEYFQLIHPDDRPSVARQKRWAIDAGVPFEVTYRVRTADDTWRWVQEQGRGVYDGEGDGETLSFVEGFVSDVTESKRREQLRVLNRVLRHNVRNEVSVLSGYAERLKAVVDEQTETVDVVLESANRIAQIGKKARTIQELLNVEPATDRTELPLESLLESAVINARTRFPQATIRYEIDGDGPQTIYAVDDVRVALDELLENAVVHNDSETSEVVIRVREGETECKNGDENGTGTAAITIADNGPGIPADERRAIRTKAESPLDHSSGLGLWIVSWIVNISRGTLTIHNDDGAVVTMSLPTPSSDHADESTTTGLE